MQPKPQLEKVIILGSPGSGKSELAEELGRILNLDKNLIHNLDEYFWKPGWNKTSLKEREIILEKLTSSPQWIIDGNFFNVIDKLLDAADYVIFLNISKWISYWRLLVKWASYLFTGISEIAPGCKDRVTFKYLKDIFLFSTTEGKLIRENAVKKLGLASVRIINSPQELSDFLDELRKRSSA